MKSESVYEVHAENITIFWRSIWMTLALIFEAFAAFERWGCMVFV